MMGVLKSFHLVLRHKLLTIHVLTITYCAVERKSTIIHSGLRIVYSVKDVDVEVGYICGNFLLLARYVPNVPKRSRPI